jgi:hypothetical protein
MKNYYLYNYYFFKACVVLDKLNLYHILYNRFIENRHKTKHKNQNDLILVLGVGRSGSTWLSNTLAKSSSIGRFYEEPLYKSKFPILLNDFNHKEHTAIPNNENEKYKVRLDKFINLLQLSTMPENIFLKCGVDKTYRKRDDIGKVLIKEVHALLGYENFINKKQTKIILLKRNFYQHVDSIMEYVGIESPLLLAEFLSLNNIDFFEKIEVRNIKLITDIITDIKSVDNKRSKVILIRTFVVFIISKYFGILNRNRNVLLVDYDDLVLDRDGGFQHICEFLEINYKERAYIFNERQHVIRNDEEIKMRKYKFLNSGDIILMKSTIERLEAVF